jgi:hypothetical protein
MPSIRFQLEPVSAILAFTFGHNRIVRGFHWLPSKNISIVHVSCVWRIRWTLVHLGRVHSLSTSGGLVHLPTWAYECRHATFI